MPGGHGKVLVVPTGKGGSVVQVDGFHQLRLQGNAPEAMIIRYPDTMRASSAIVMGIPMVNKLPEEFYDCVKHGVATVADSHQGTVTAAVEEQVLRRASKRGAPCSGSRIAVKVRRRASDG